MKRFRLVLANLILVLAAASCATGMRSPDLGGSPTPVSSGATGATAVTPTSSLSATAAFVSGGAAIPFQSLAQGFRLDSAQFQPALLIAVDAASRDGIVSLVDPKDQTPLKTLDLERELALAAFWGVQPYGGFSITIRSVSITDSYLTVDVILRENDPAVPKVDASTYPYHLVTIDRLALPMEAVVRYRLVSGDRLLATGELP